MVKWQDDLIFWTEARLLVTEDADVSHVATIVIRAHGAQELPLLSTGTSRWRRNTLGGGHRRRTL